MIPIKVGLITEEEYDTMYMEDYRWRKHPVRGVIYQIDTLGPEDGEGDMEIPRMVGYVDQVMGDTHIYPIYTNPRVYPENYLTTQEAQAVAKSTPALASLLGGL